MTKDHKREKQALPDVVSQWYYKHGLFLSSYPTCSIGIAVIIFLISCYPLLNIPLPGTIPTKLIYPFEANENLFDDKIRNFSLVKDIFNVNSSFNPPFQWAQNKPALYVQQIILRTGVHPWLSDMHVMDAFRAPLFEVFKLLETVRNHECSSTNLDNICLHVDNVKQMKVSLFPEYNCLVLSPANFWSQDIQNFSKDGNILNTIFQRHSFQKGKVSIAEMLLGLPMEDTGLKRYPIRSRSRIIQYAITIILKKYDRNFVESLKNKLVYQYPLFQTNNNDVKPKKSDHDSNEKADTTESPENQQNKINEAKSSVMYIYYPGELKIAEFMPLCIAFILLFIYVYFSVRKIDVIKSRFILATFAVFTVLGSLMMSLGLCFFFGLTISLQSVQSKGIFPYLVILVGLENCLVLTKSVVSTDETFDNKIRVAQALSKEGWHISKTLLTEITILTAGLGTFVPVIQEFCVFAIVGLISDFVLQMLFFSTGLAMNIKRMEYQYEAKNLPKIMSYDHKQREFKNFTGYNFSPLNHHSPGSGFHRSHSFPKLSINEINKTIGENSCKRLSSNNSQDQKIPKRLRIVNFWARTRFFQRAFMIWMSIWIFSIVYNSEFLEHFLVIDLSNSSSFVEDVSVRNFDSNDLKNPTSQNSKSSKTNGVYHVDIPETTTDKSFAKLNIFSETEEQIKEQKKYKHPDYEINYYLSNFHWSEILSQYNITLAETYIAVLPSIKLSKIITPETAIVLRNPKDQLIKNFRWKTLAAALDPLDFNDNDKNVIREKPILQIGATCGTPLYPKSPMEIFIVAMLCAISVFVLTYTMVVFYRCICTRNYAEWRSSWNEAEAIPNVEQILEGVPLHLPGHTHKIECLVSDGLNVISCCLRGQIKVWDVECGDMLLNIDRTKNEINYFSNIKSFDFSNKKKGAKRISEKTLSPVWCMDCLNNIVALGCANGRIEFWEVPTGILKCAYEEETKEKQGITHITLVGDRVIAAKLSGRLDFYRLETYYKGKQIDWGFTSAYRRTHVRTSSAGSIGLVKRGVGINTIQEIGNKKEGQEEIVCTLEETKSAHQQPITSMEVVNGMIFTGSKDHTLRVFNMYDSNIEFTLHGHFGPITCLFVDKWQHGSGGSGSQDGLLCIWDLYTGACMYNIQAHDGSISSLACAPSYVISIGTDERVCVWERFQGNLLSTINISNAYSKLCMLTPSLLVTSKPGSLIVWDVRTGEPAREVKLGSDFSQICPKIMILANSSIICDYGNQIRIVKFPIVADKNN